MRTLRHKHEEKGTASNLDLQKTAFLKPPNQLICYQFGAIVIVDLWITLKENQTLEPRPLFLRLKIGLQRKKQHIERIRALVLLQL